MAKLISESVRKRIIDIAEKNGFDVQLKSNKKDQYVKNLMFYSKTVNQTVYIRKDRAVGDGGIPTHFQVAVHPDFFKKRWATPSEGIEELINRQKQKNLHSSSNYKKFPVFSENYEPCGKCFKVADYDALGKLFQRMETGEISEAQESIDSIPSDKKQDNEVKAVISINRDLATPISKKELPVLVESLNSIPTKGLVIKSPYIEKIISGSKTWEMRSTLTKIRGPIALIKQGSGQIIGVANLVDTKGPLSQQDKINAMDKHQISIDRLQSGETDKWNSAWVMENAQPLISPINYQHPNGAVIWVNLEPQVQEKLAIVMQ